jgi:hypothetical protein
MTSEAELKEAVASHIVSLPLSVWQEMKKNWTDVSEKQAIELYEKIATGIHSLYIQAGYVMLTRDEARYLTTVSITDDGGEYNFHLSRSIQGKLRSRLEVKE